MGRKNNKVRSANQKGRLGRGEARGAAPRTPFKEQPRVPVEQMIIPDGHCPGARSRRPKARFATAEKAKAALEQAQQQRRRTGSTHVEKRYYKCPADGCDGYHLSSREEYDEGIRIQREAQFQAKTKNARLAQIAAEQEVWNG